MPRCVQGIDAVRTLEARWPGSADAIYPTCVRIAQIKFPINYALVGLQLSSSLVIFGTNLGGILVVVGQNAPVLAISDSINSVMSHITQPNSFSGAPPLSIPTSKVTSESFGAFAMPIVANAPISLYAFGDATAGNDLFAICSLQLVRIR